MKKPVAFLKCILSFALCLIINVTVSGQDTCCAQRPAFLQASLLYDFPQSYGMMFSADQPIASHVRRSSTGLVKKQKDFFIQLNLGFYRYPFNYSGLLFYPSFGIRYFKKAHYFSELSLGAGLLRTFYDGAVYEVTQGGIIKQPLFGRFYALTSLSYAANWQLNWKEGRMWALTLQPSLWVQYPFNSFVKTHLSMEAGIRYKYRSFSLTQKNRSKI